LGKFPSANLLLALHELEQQFLQLGKGIVEEQRFAQKDRYLCREMGRASGFFASANMIAEQMKRIGR